MNTERLAVIIADPAAVAELKRCTSLSELVACLNKDGAECTREEGLRFLRAWEKLETDSEAVSFSEAPRGGQSSNRLIGFFRSALARYPARRHKSAAPPSSGTLTMERLLKQMNANK